MIIAELPIPIDYLREATDLFMGRFYRIFPEESKNNIYKDNHVLIYIHTYKWPNAGGLELWKISEKRSDHKS